MPRVAIVAAATTRRENLARRIAAPGIEIVAATATLDEAGNAAPDVILVVGREETADALEWAADDELIAVVGLVADRRALDAVRGAAASVGGAGMVRGWAALPETASDREIVAAIVAADAGLAAWPAEWTTRDRGASVPAAPEFDEDEAVFGETLTPRELDVLDLLSLGLSNRRIAERLGISPHTVKFHVAAIYGKLGVSGRTAAVNRALRRGLLKI